MQTMDASAMAEAAAVEAAVVAEVPVVEEAPVTFAETAVFEGAVVEEVGVAGASTAEGASAVAVDSDFAAARDEREPAETVLAEQSGPAEVEAAHAHMAVLSEDEAHEARLPGGATRARASPARLSARALAHLRTHTVRWAWNSVRVTWTQPRQPQPPATRMPP